jgi:ubiquinol-cytochrome c reductase cytochrome b subunit/menaquinol-cytochrome c reductase cytochrome b/c subunit
MRFASPLARVLVLAIGVALAGCGGGGDEPATATTATAPRIALKDQRATGALFVEQAGCLACHQLGPRGNSGPGSNLSGIGERRSAAQIRGALLDAPAPMPSYRRLSRRTLDAVVAYLTSLRPACPDDSDCG